MKYHLMKFHDDGFDRRLVIDYLNRPALARYLDRTTGGLTSLHDAGLIPDPDARIVTANPGPEDSLWSVALLASWFSSIHDDQAVLVPAGAFARREMTDYSAYACPATRAHFVGLARPSLLGMKDAGTVTVRPVTAIASNDARFGALGHHGRAASKVLADLAAARLAYGEDPETLTLFLVGKPVGTFTHTAVLRQGRVVRAQALRDALDAGTVHDITRKS